MRGSRAPGPQLLTYPDSLGGDLASIRGAARRAARTACSAASTSCRRSRRRPTAASRPLTYREIDPRFGTWADIRALAARPRRAPGPDGQPHLAPERGVPGLRAAWPAVRVRRPVHHARQGLAGRSARRGRRRPHLPAQARRPLLHRSRSPTPASARRSGRPSGPPTGPSRSTSTSGRRTTRRLDRRLARLLRLPGRRGSSASMPSATSSRSRARAASWSSRRSGRSSTGCVGVADGLGLVVLPEVHDVYATHEKLAAHGYWTYDFVLPGLVLHAFETGDADRLAAHLARSPERQFTTLDCHDGIPVRPRPRRHPRPRRDAPPRRRRRRRAAATSTGSSPTAMPMASMSTSSTAPTTRRSAEDDDRYVAARAIQLFAPRHPAGLLRRPARGRERPRGGRADRGRARHQPPRLHAHERSRQALERPVVRRTLELLRSPSNTRRIQRTADVETPRPNALRLAWSDRGSLMRARRGHHLQQVPGHDRWARRRDRRRDAGRLGHLGGGRIVGERAHPPLSSATHRPAATRTAPIARCQRPRREPPQIRGRTMRITGVRTVMYEYPLRHPIGDVQSQGCQRMADLAVFLETDEALVGVAIAGAGCVSRPCTRWRRSWSVATRGRSAPCTSGCSASPSRPGRTAPSRRRSRPWTARCGTCARRRMACPSGASSGASSGRVAAYASGLDMALSDDELRTYYRRMSEQLRHPGGQAQGRPRSGSGPRAPGRRCATRWPRVRTAPGRVS